MFVKSLIIFDEVKLLLQLCVLVDELLHILVDL